MSSEQTAALAQALATLFDRLLAGLDNVTAVGVIMDSAGNDSALTVQTSAGETSALINSGMEFVTDSDEVRDQFRWDPRAHQVIDHQALSAAIEEAGLQGHPGLADQVVAALRSLVDDQRLAPQAVRTIVVTDDPDPDRAQARIEAINPSGAASTWVGVEPGTAHP